MNSSVLLCLFLALLSPPILPAQVFHDSYFRSKADEGLALTYNFQFEEAAAIFSQLEEEYAHHPAPYFLLATNRWWQSYISVDQAYHGYIQEQLDIALEKNEELEDAADTHLEFTFFQYMCYAFHTRLHILRREWLSAANEGRKALPYLRDGLEYAADSKEFYFSAGIYHYYAATYPEAHVYVRPFMVFFPDGDEQKGLEELAQAAYAPNFTQAEAMYYLSDIYLNRTGENERALDLKEALNRTYPNNSWFKLDYARALVHMQRYDEAETLLLEMMDEFEAIQDYHARLISSVESPYTTQVMEHVYHYQGVVLMKRYAAYEQAIENFDFSLTLGQWGDWDNSPLPPSNYLHMGLCYDRLGERGGAIQAYELALDCGETDHVQHQAKECLTSPCLE